MRAAARLTTYTVLLALVLGVVVGCADPRRNVPDPTITPTPTPATAEVGADGQLIPLNMLSKDIVADTRWTIDQSPYHVLLPITVLADVTLTIDPGVLVYFEPGVALNVVGTLVADGVTFQPRRPQEMWAGLTFFGTTTSSVSNSRIINAQNGVSCADSFPRLVGNTIGPTGGFGIICIIGKNVPVPWEVSGNTISDTGDAGIQVWVNPQVFPDAALNITNNTVSNSGQAGIGAGSTQWFEGIWQSNGVNMVIAGNTIQNAAAHGVLLRNISGITVQQNVIANNAQAAVALQPAHDVVVAYNWLTGTNGVGLLIDEAPNQPWSNVLVQCNLVDNNSMSGVRLFQREFGQTPSTAFRATFTRNEIAANGEYSIYVAGDPIAVNAPNNYLGAPDSSTVETLLRDQLDDPGVGRVNYGPLLGAPLPRDPGQCP